MYDYLYEVLEEASSSPSGESRTGVLGFGKRQGQSTEQLERTLQVDGCVLCPDRHVGYTHTHTFAETHLNEIPQTHTIVLVSGYWCFDA